MTSMKPEKSVLIKKHKKEGTRDESFPVTENSKYSQSEETSDMDETFLTDPTFEESCDCHIQYLQDLAKVAVISFDTYKDDKDEFKDSIDYYRKYMIEKSALMEALNGLKVEMAVLDKKIQASLKVKKKAGKKMKNSKSVMTGYFMKVSEHKKAHTKTLLKTQKKLTKQKSQSGIRSET